MMAAMAQRWLPFLAWQRPTRSTLWRDLMAGLTVSLLAIPQCMAYAQLCGVPAQYGLYGAFIPSIVGALFGSSALLSTGPVALTSLLTAASVGLVAAPGSANFYAAVTLMALLSGLMQIGLGLARAGMLLSLLSHPVLVGFINAAAVVITLSQVPALLGITVPPGGSALGDLWHLLTHLGQLHLPSALLGLLAVQMLVVAKRMAPRLPGVLIMVATLTAISWAIDFSGRGGKVVGAIPTGLPGLSLPTLDWPTVVALLPAALVVSLVSFTEAMSSCKLIALKTQTRWDENQELIGQGLANIGGSFFQSYPACGSFTGSAINLQAGAQTGFAMVFNGLFVAIVLLFLTPFLYHLPKATLAVIILLAVTSLITPKALKHTWQASRADGFVALATFVLTLVAAPHLDKGILIGAALAILLYLYRTMKPRVAILGRCPDGTLRDIKVNPGLITSEHVIALRFDGALYFANVAHFEDAVLEAVADHKQAKYLLVVGNGINRLDASGEEVIHHLVERLRANGMDVFFSGLKKQTLDVMRATGLFDLIGEGNIFPTENKALAAIYERLGPEAADDMMCPPLPTRA